MMMQMKVVLWLILDELKEFLVLRYVRVARNLKYQTLKCSDLGSCISHGLNTDGPIMISN